LYSFKNVDLKKVIFTLLIESTEVVI